jgi:ureidoacrylate peracid hydrolase
MQCSAKSMCKVPLLIRSAGAAGLRAVLTANVESVVLEDGCAAFDRATHETAIAALKTVARVATVARMIAETGPR